MPCGRVRLQYSHRITRKNALDLILCTGNFKAERGFYPSTMSISSLAAGYMPSENVLCTGILEEIHRFTRTGGHSQSRQELGKLNMSHRHRGTL